MILFHVQADLPKDDDKCEKLAQGFNVSHITFEKLFELVRPLNISQPL